MRFDFQIGPNKNKDEKFVNSDNAIFDDQWLRLRIKRDILYINGVEAIPIPTFYRKSGL